MQCVHTLYGSRGQYNQYIIINQFIYIINIWSIYSIYAWVPWSLVNLTRERLERGSSTMWKRATSSTPWGVSCCTCVRTWSVGWLVAGKVSQQGRSVHMQGFIQHNSTHQWTTELHCAPNRTEPAATVTVLPPTTLPPGLDVWPHLGPEEEQAAALLQDVICRL